MRNRLDTAVDAQLEMMLGSLSKEEKLSLTNEQHEAMVFEAFIAGARTVCSLPLSEFGKVQNDR